ncbi:MAG: hypothetical protein HN952_04335 [Candidatus Cloacimonetes bacterium]|jgi:hypothetical protein|nr:hypothetical protein [Candidatus Cloacimonadota bacterium]MBT6994166.1 hypothetical protein [Candidatus Cloacimonadota bacterium]
MKILLNVATIVIGAVAGWLYYKFVGCRTGACPLTSNPYSSMIFGAIFGYLFLSSFVEKILK